MNRNLLRVCALTFAAAMMGFFAVAQPTLTDDVVSDFNAGLSSQNVDVTNVSGGEVTVRNAFSTSGNSLMAQDFSSGRGALWTYSDGAGWGTPGSESYPGGVATIQGAHIYTAPVYYKNMSLQFVANFADENYQYVGLTSDIAFAGEYILIGRISTDPPFLSTHVYARVNAKGVVNYYDLGTGLTGADHTYRIVWQNSDAITFYVDGAAIQTVSATFNTSAFRLQISDLNSGGLPVKVDEIYSAPYEGNFISRIFTAISPFDWRAVQTTQTVGSGTTVNYYMRAGSSGAQVNGTGWQAVNLFPNYNVAGAISGQYVQYQFQYAQLDPKTATHVDLVTLYASYMLPVTYSELSAMATGNDVKLSWKTATEQNNKGFHVLRSTDQVKWANLGFVDGAGNASTTKNYSFTDQGLNTGRYFYRLEQEDIDGKISLSNIVSANISKNLQFSLSQNYPNPSHGSSVISYSIPQNTHVRITMYDVNGRIVKVVEDAQRSAGSYTISIDQNRMNSGIYIYKMEAGSFIATKKMIVQN